MLHLAELKKLKDLVVERMTLERLQAAKISPNLQYRLHEEERLNNLHIATLQSL